MSESSAKTTVKPFLRWAGSKRQLIPELSRYWDASYSRYVEPFAGSASLFFSLAPSSAILGDVNLELIATYEQVKNCPSAVIAALSTMRKGKNNYLKLRAIKPLTLSPAMRAARFIYLNRFCFNGLYRTNRMGEFNVPYSGDRTGKLASKTTLAQCSKRLQSVELVLGSFDVTLRKAKSGDFVYLDPPFSVKARRVFNEYDAAIFSQRQLELLRQWMLQLNRKGISFLVSYAESEEGDFLREGFFTQVVGVRRNIAGFAANRRRANELLISNVRPKDIGEAL